MTASALSIFAAIPSNDNLANAMVVAGPAESTLASTDEATREAGEPFHLLNAPIQRTVWFQWTAPETKPVFFLVTTFNFDAAMAVYTGSSYPLQQITYNNDTDGNQPRIEFMATAGTTYKIAVGVYSSSSTAPGGSFHLLWTQSSTPANNNFTEALAMSGSSGSVALTNLGATAEAGEPSFGSGKTVWVNYTNTGTSDIGVTFDTRENIDPSFDTTLAVYTGAAVNSLTTVVKNNDAPGALNSRVSFLAKTGITYRIAVDSAVSTPASNIILSWRISKPAYYTDFGKKIGTTGEIYYDEAADITVFRPSDGTWYSLDSGDGTFSAFHFGTTGDTPVPADYDGDGRTDYAVARNENGLKIWYIHSSFDGSYKIVHWGITEDRLVPGDFDYDGRADVAVFRPSTNSWYILRSSDGQILSKNFGQAGDVPILGDFKNTPPGTDIAIFRPSNGTWCIFDGLNTIVIPFGTNGDIPFPADYGFDGVTDLAVYRPSNGTWYYRPSNGNPMVTVQWGTPGDIPQGGDFDANTNDPSDFTVYRPSDRTWYILKSEGFQTAFVQFGAPGDIPISSFAP